MLPPARCNARVLSFVTPSTQSVPDTLVAALAEAVEAHEAGSGLRTYRRGPDALGKLHKAVAAIVGGVTAPHGDPAMPDAWFCHPRRSSAFRGHPVPKRAFDAALARLKALGLVEGAGSLFRATPALMAKATVGRA